MLRRCRLIYDPMDKNTYMQHVILCDITAKCVYKTSPYNPFGSKYISLKTNQLFPIPLTQRLYHDPPSERV